MKGKILFVDDDPRLINLYLEVMRERDFEVEHFDGPDEALDYFKRGETADVVVWDMMMAPGEAFAHEDTNGGTTTGAHLYRAIKKLAPSTKFVLLTNLSRDTELEKTLECLMLCKAETGPKQLVEIVASLLDRA